MSAGYVLSLCDFSAIAVLPWAAAGFTCYCVDWKHPDGYTPHPIYPNVILVGADIRTFIPLLQKYDFVMAFPPCTEFAGSGARWWEDKQPYLLEEALQIAWACRRICEASGAPYYIENPVGRLGRLWKRKPDYYFHPHEYAGYLSVEQQAEDAYQKKTCAWAGGGFVMPEKKPVPLPQDKKLAQKIWYMSPGADRADRRSVTPLGWSIAVHMANSHLFKGETA